MNAGLRHYVDGIAALEKADPAWFSRLITRTVPLSDWTTALTKNPDDVKVVVDLQG